MAIFCSACGTQNPDTSTFCTKCGKAITQPVAPATASGAAAAPAAAANNNVMGGIAYLTFIPAIILLLIEPYKNDRFVRFHCWQCLILSAARFVVGIALFFIPFSRFMFSAIVGVLFFVAWLVAIINAFQGKMWKIPGIGDMAESQAK